MPIAEECFEDYTTLEGKQIRVFRNDCAYENLIEDGRVLVERQLNDIAEIAWKPSDDEDGKAFVLVTIPKEARGPQGWHAVDDPKLRKAVIKIARQRFRDWLRENGVEDDDE